MRWTVQVPVTWPTERGWDGWWRHVLAQWVGPDDGGGLFSRDGGQARLAAGEHLRPGAIYRWLPPKSTTIGAAAWGIGGTNGARDCYLEYQESVDPRRRVTARLDGLERCGEDALALTSTLKHLAAEVSFRRQRDGLLDAEVKLDWLLVRAQARVLPQPEGEALRVTLRVVGRGIWKPVIAPFLVTLSPFIQDLLEEDVSETAERMTHLDTDPRGDGAPERELDRIRAGAELIRERLHEVVRAVDARRWWKGRGTRFLREAFAALPALGPEWPAVTPAVSFAGSGRWRGEEQWLFDSVVARAPRRRKRHEAVDREVEAWWQQQEQMVAFRTQKQDEFTAARVPGSDFTHFTGEELNETLSLSWLRSPWSMVRFLATWKSRASADGEAPEIETDDDARRLVTDMLGELKSVTGR